MPVYYYIFLSATLFTIGVIGVLVRRNAIIVFMCIELMLNAANLLLVAFSKMHSQVALPNSTAATPRFLLRPFLMRTLLCDSTA